jgi:hypothetical protein
MKPTTRARRAVLRARYRDTRPRARYRYDRRVVRRERRRAANAIWAHVTESLARLPQVLRDLEELRGYRLGREDG